MEADVQATMDEDVDSLRSSKSIEADMLAQVKQDVTDQMDLSDMEASVRDRYLQVGPACRPGSLSRPGCPDLPAAGCSRAVHHPDAVHPAHYPQMEMAGLHKPQLAAVTWAVRLQTGQLRC